MLSLRIDLFIHSTDEGRIEKKLDDVLDAVKALGEDPKKLADLNAELKGPIENLDAAVSANPVPTP